MENGEFSLSEQTGCYIRLVWRCSNFAGKHMMLQNHKLFVAGEVSLSLEKTNRLKEEERFTYPAFQYSSIIDQLSS